MKRSLAIAVVYLQLDSIQISLPKLAASEKKSTDRVPEMISTPLTDAGRDSRLSTAIENLAPISTRQLYPLSPLSRVKCRRRTVGSSVRNVNPLGLIASRMELQST
jgi:hypothetical protein